jgi:N-acetylmuramoyl-L-alanine amidase
MTARGYSVFTTKGETNSDTVAEIIMKQFAVDFPELKVRADKSDGDLDKEEDFTVILKADCPAVLIE